MYLTKFNFPLNAILSLVNIQTNINSLSVKELLNFTTLNMYIIRMTKRLKEIYRHLHT